MTGDEGAFRHRLLLFANAIVGSQEWHCHTTMCSPTEKKESVCG
jgi:hypothetical protein